MQARSAAMQNRTTKKLCYYNGSNSMIDGEREREREGGRRREGERWMSRIKGQTHKSKFVKPTLTELHSTPHYAPLLSHS